AMTAEERATRLAIVRRAVAAVEALPAPSEHRPSLAAALSQLGAFDEALRVARRIDQKAFQEPGQIDAILALQRISFDQARWGKHGGARAEWGEAPRVEMHANADAQGTRAGLASAFVVARGYDEAMKLAQALDPAGRAAIWSQVAKHKRLDGDRDGVEVLFR